MEVDLDVILDVHMEMDVVVVLPEVDAKKEVYVEVEVGLSGVKVEV